VGKWPGGGVVLSYWAGECSKTRAFTGRFLADRNKFLDIFLGLFSGIREPPGCGGSKSLFGPFMLGIDACAVT